MIFSKQLGSLGGRTAQDDIRYMANHIRRMQEELEYRLAHLDSQNITEIDMSQTKIYSGDVELLTLIKSGDQFSSIQQTVDEIALTVYGGVDKNGETVTGLSELIVGKGGIQATVANLQTGLASTVKLLNNGLWVENADGSMTQINGGHIKLSGSISFGDLTDGLQEDLSFALEEAGAAEKIADGKYRGTFINRTSIYSPTIYSNEFNVYSNEADEGGSFNLYAEYDDEMMHFLEIAYYQEGTSAPTISFNSPCSAYADWAFGYTRFYGTVDFSGCDDVIW